MAVMVKFDMINLYQCEKGFATNERFLDFHYFLYVHRGKGQYKIGDKTYRCAAGDLYYCPPMIGNTILADGTDPFLLSGLDFRILNDLAEEQKMRDSLPLCLNIQSQGFLQQLIQKMIEEYTYNKRYSGEICNALLSSLIYSLVRLKESDHSDSDRLILSILEYIQDGIRRDITHEELSRVFSYHKSSINRMLVAATGMSLKNYQIDLRLKKAMELLTYSTKPQGEIAAMCGYKSQVFFSRQFKDKVGLTPTEYRKSR